MVQSSQLRSASLAPQCGSKLPSLSRSARQCIPLPVWKSTSASGVQSASPRHRAGAASMAWRTTRRLARTRRKILTSTQALAQTRIRAERERVVVVDGIAVLRVDALDEGAVVLQFVDADVAADPRHVVVGRDLVQRAPAALFDVLLRGPAALRLRPLTPAVIACVKIKISRRGRAESSRRPPRHRRDRW